MAHPLHTASSTRSRIDQPFLIIDKEGSIALPLALSVQDHFVTVVVSAHEIPLHANTVHIPYQKIPVLPNNIYSYYVLVYHGEKELLASLPSIAAQASANKAPVLFLITLCEATDEIIDTVLRAYDHAMVVVYGELYGNGVPTTSHIVELLSQVARGESMTLPNSGLHESYPVFLPDLIRSLEHICFGTEAKHRIYLLLPKHAYSSFALARIIKSIYPEASINVTSESLSLPGVFIPTNGTYALNETPLLDALQTLKISSVRPLAGMRQQKKRRPTHRAPKMSLFPLLGLFALFLFLFAMPFLLGGIAGIRAIQNVQKGSIAQALTDTSFALPLLQIADREIVLLNHIVPLKPMEPLASTLNVMTDGLGQLHDSLKAATLLSHSIVGGQGLNRADFDGAIATLSQAASFYEKLEASHTLPLSLQSKSKELDAALNTFLEIRPMLPGLLGYTRKRTYLILFQNNMELRPGGGFIGSYGLLNIEKGKIGSLTIHDVYDADGQLKGHIDPPLAISRYLGASHWYLRDSNVSVDGKINTDEALSFLKLETGESADGVLSIDVSFLSQLLSVTGPLTLPDYNEIVTKDNFYLLTEEHAQKNFFPGSTQKKDFLRSVATSLESRLFHPTEHELLPLLSEILKGIQTKHLLVDSLIPSERTLLTLTDFNNALWDTRKLGDNRINDFLGIREANVGQNKVNYYLTRSLQQHAAVQSDGTVTDSTTATYHNGSTLSSNFGGTYKSYVELVVPQGAKLTGVAVNGAPVAYQEAITDSTVYKSVGFVPPLEREIETKIVSGKTVFGTYVETPPQTTVSLTIEYTLPKIVPPSKEITYSLMLSKQPGTNADQYQFSLIHPEGTIIAKDGRLSSRGNTIMYNGTLMTDMLFSIQLSQ